ncbi:MAG: MauE/DoxX family redox-associated membrane protein [Tepidisphaeraceae bacterium]
MRGPRRIYHVGTRVTFGLLFLWAGAARVTALRVPPASRPHTAVSRIVGTSTPAHAILATGELALAILLLREAARPRGRMMPVAFLMIAVFTGTLVAEVQRPDPKPCGCFLVSLMQAGSEQSENPETVRRDLRLSIARNIALLIVAVVDVTVALPVAQATRGYDTGGSIEGDHPLSSVKT